MKKIHKKIGAMALAGMVVAGGVAVSGGSSHAASLISELPSVSVSKESSIDALGNIKKYSVKEVMDICKELHLGIRVRAVANSKQAMDKYIGKIIKRPSVRKKLLNSARYGNADVLKKELKEKKKSGEKVFRCSYDDLEFLFFL